MKHLNLAIAVAAAMLTISCQKGTEPNLDPTSSDGLQLSASQIEFQSSDREEFSASSVGTRVTESSFQNGDMLGVYVHTSASVAASGNHSSNMRYTTLDGGATWRASNALGDSFATGTTYNGTAYYPYSATVSNPTSVGHTVAKDQSSAASAAAGALENSDFMISSPTTLSEVMTPTPKVSFTMSHAMTKLVVSVSVPTMIEGVSVTGIKSVSIEGTKIGATVNLSTRVVAASGAVSAITPRRVSGDGLAGKVSRYEAIVVPQVLAGGVKLVRIVCSTAGTDKELSYVVPTSAPLTLEGGKKVLLTLSSSADLSFTKELDLIDGLAKTDLEFGVSVAVGKVWTLTAPDGGWLKLSLSKGNSSAGYTVSGTGTGLEQKIYVTVGANVATSSNGMVREAPLTLSSVGLGSVVYGAIQNYYAVAPTLSTTVPVNEQVFPVAAFGSNQIWTAKSDVSWLKLSTSPTYGEGVVATYTHTGSLSANRLYYHLEPNVTPANRTAKITFTSTSTVGGPTALQTTIQPVNTAIPINGILWARGNLVANGANGCKIGAPTDFGLYFHFGSLVGWAGGANGDGTGSHTTEAVGPALAVKVKPAAYAATPAWPAPYYKGGTTSADIVPFATGNGASAIGDACRHYLGSLWRLPTTSEFFAMCNNVPNGSAPAAANAAWQTSPAGMNFNNNSTKLFMPVSGYRDPIKSSFSNIGLAGYYWSASVASVAHGYNLGFSSAVINSQLHSDSDRAYGLPIRCVQ